MVDVRDTAPDGPPTRAEPRPPVVAASEIEIAARPEVVWAVLTEFGRWPSWNPDVTSMSMDAPVAVGSTFRWKAGPGTITSTIQRIEAPRLIAWTGRTLGIKAVDSWHLQPQEGTTLVREDESWDGVVARVFRRPLQKTLDRSLENGLRHLKAEAEQRAAAGGQ